MTTTLATPATPTPTRTPRAFIYDGREFPDPDPRLSVEEVRKQFAEFLPELTNADTREEKRADGTVVYTFSKRIGTKGRPRGVGDEPAAAADAEEADEAALAIRQRCADVVRILRSVPEKRLRVFELAGQVLNPAGELDFEAAADREPEINLAIAEVRAYAHATEQAVQALRRLAPRA
jgi:PRTRC genetic system protein C